MLFNVCDIYYIATCCNIGSVISTEMDENVPAIFLPLFRRPFSNLLACNNVLCNFIRRSVESYTLRLSSNYRKNFKIFNVKS